MIVERLPANFPLFIFARHARSSLACCVSDNLSRISSSNKLLFYYSVRVEVVGRELGMQLGCTHEQFLLPVLKSVEYTLHHKCVLS